MKKSRFAFVIAVALILAGSAFAQEHPPVPPDLTKSNAVDRALTYNLGATGLRGWIYSEPASYFDGLQGRATAASRQILVTHVGAKSPADGVMQVDDIILGVDGKPFTDDARKSIAFAIQEAEKETRGGILKLIRWRAGKTEEVQLKLRIMGTYAETAPYNCPKSKRILEEASKVLEKEPLEESWSGAINGLALLATGNPDYLPRLQEFARKLGPTTLKVNSKEGMGIWNWGYRNIFLCEYYLLTHDKEVLHAINEYTIALAKGQSMYGTFGHGVSSLTSEGKLHGSVPPYGPMNMAGLPANLAIVMGKKCGVNDPEIDPAIERASGFFGYYADKGAIPYGEHEPWPYHENNGKCSMAAVFFGVQGNRIRETQIFAKMATAGYKSRECGHTGQGFSYLWSALGVNAGGPNALAAFFKESSWHLDLERRCDGSFIYDGSEQYGPGKTDDNTYYGKSSYYGLSPAATYVLTYSLPLKKLYITGKDANRSNWLSKKAAARAIASGSFDLDRKQKKPRELVASFSDWSPIVRSWAAEELASRPEAQAMLPALIKMAKGNDVHVAQGACETLGYLKSQEALSILVNRLSHKDRWLRFIAAEAIKNMGAVAKPAIPDILKAIVQTAEPLEPINWADPVQLTHGQLAEALFATSLIECLKGVDSQLLYPAIRVLSKNANGMTRLRLRVVFEDCLGVEAVKALGPDILAAIVTESPADKMFSWKIRMGGLKALTKYHFREGIDACVIYAKTQGSWNSESRTGEIMKELVSYGTAARRTIPELKELIVSFQKESKNGEFPAELNDARIIAIEEAIKAIESATTEPELRSITMVTSKDSAKKK